MGLLKRQTLKVEGAKHKNKQLLRYENTNSRLFCRLFLSSGYRYQEDLCCQHQNSLTEF